MVMSKINYRRLSYSYFTLFYSFSSLIVARTCQFLHSTPAGVSISLSGSLSRREER